MSRKVFIIGDGAIDWRVIDKRAGEFEGAWQNIGMEVDVNQLKGGMWLVHALVERSIASGLPQSTIEVESIPGSPQSTDKADNSVDMSYSVWSRFPKSRTDRAPVYRLRQFLGIRKQSSPRVDYAPLASCTDKDLVIVYDVGLHSRDRYEETAKYLQCKPTVIVRLADPLPSQRELKFITDTTPGTVIALTTASELRLGQSQISRGKSWESTVSDLQRELKTSLAHLTHFGALVVLFPFAGAIVYTQSNQTCLIYDSAYIEGDWEEERPGELAGHSIMLASSVAFQLLARNNVSSSGQALSAMLAHAAERSIAAMRSFHEQGLDNQYQIPLKSIVNVLIANSDATTPFLNSLDIPPQLNDNSFSIFATIKKNSDVLSLAKKIVQEGMRVLRTTGVPVARFGKLEAIDRREAESFRHIRWLFKEYMRRSERRPLSIGVFGPPGSGKSFGIREIASSIEGSNLHPIVFNLASFRAISDLHAAFHLVRDIALSGKVPLVLWDEFDAQFDGELGWLKYFLAPMQDGEFQEGAIVHSIGRSVFVFAGGVYQSASSFLDEIGQKIAAKAPDFASRLRGFIDIPGIGSASEDKTAALSDSIILRRAIMLRLNLEKHFPKLVRDGQVDIDEGVLDAFLKVSSYRHGVRSLEAIVTMSTLHGRRRYDRSSLPPVSQLALHVDAESFLRHLQ